MTEQKGTTLNQNEIIEMAEDVKATASRLLKDTKTTETMDKKLTAIGVTTVQLQTELSNVSDTIKTASADIDKISVHQDKVIEEQDIARETLVEIDARTRRSEQSLIDLLERAQQIQNNQGTNKVDLLSAINESHTSHENNLQVFKDKLGNIENNVQRVDYAERIQTLEKSTEQVLKEIADMSELHTREHSEIMERLDQFDAAVASVVAKANNLYNTNMDVTIRVDELYDMVTRLNESVNTLNIEHTPKDTEDIMQMFKELAEKPQTVELTDKPAEELEETEKETNSVETPHTETVEIETPVTETVETSEPATIEKPKNKKFLGIF